jgi:hypothetical protein
MRYVAQPRCGSIDAIESIDYRCHDRKKIGESIGDIGAIR